MALNRQPSRLIRAFVAIRVPAEVLTCLAAVQGELKRLLAGNSIAWSRPENMHLTLRFLGNIELTRVPALEKRMRSTLAGFGPVDLICERLGCFPDGRSPRVVWAGVHDSHERLQQLHRRIDDALSEFAEKPAESRFVGHITLARPKQIRQEDAERLARFVAASMNRGFGRWRASIVHLFRSELAPAGSNYQELADASLV